MAMARSAPGTAAMNYRWTVRAYTIMRPVLGHRASMQAADFLPAVLMAIGGILVLALLAAL